MKKISLIVFLSTGLLGCQQSDKLEELDKEISKSIEGITVKPTIIGEIVQIESGRFLVENKAEKLPDGRPDAIWFSTDESYRGQANAEKIEINE